MAPSLLQTVLKQQACGSGHFRVSKVFSVISFLSPRSQPRLFWAVLDYSGSPEKVLRMGVWRRMW